MYILRSYALTRRLRRGLANKKCSIYTANYQVNVGHNAEEEAVSYNWHSFLDN